MLHEPELITLIHALRTYLDTTLGLSFELRHGIKALYVASELSSVSRSWLVGTKVPFVVPGRQLYLPPLGIDFRERFPAPRAGRTHLSTAAQEMMEALVW